MKKLYLLFICTIILLASNVYAEDFSVSCDPCHEDGSCNYNETFYCKINGPTERYDYIKGTVDKNENLSCEIFTTTLNIIADSSRTFNLKGTPYGNTIVTIACTVSKKPAYTSSYKMKISDFEYSVNKEITNLSLSSPDKYIGSELINYDIIINKSKDADINVKNRDVTHEDSLLKEVTIKGLDFEFSKYDTIYDLSVPNEITSLDFNIQLNLNSSSYDIQGDPKNLAEGLNVIDIVVTSKQKNVTWYTFNITRNPKGKSVYKSTKDATLKSLSVIDHDFNFDIDKDTYDILVKPGTKRVQVKATPTISGATYKVIYPASYTNGQKIEVIVTSSDGTTTKTYTINIKSEGVTVTNERNPLVIIIVIVVGLVIIGVVAFILLKKKKQPVINQKINDNKFTNSNGNNSSDIEMPQPKKDPTFFVPPQAPLDPLPEAPAPVMPDNYSGKPVTGDLSIPATPNQQQQQVQQQPQQFNPFGNNNQQ